MTAPFQRPRRGTGRALMVGNLELPEGTQMVGIAGDYTRQPDLSCPACSHEADLHTTAWGCVRTVDGDDCRCMRLRSSILATAKQRAS